MPKKYLNKDVHKIAYKEGTDSAKYNFYSELLDQYNTLIEAFNELETSLKSARALEVQFQKSIDAINATFRRLKVSDRINYFDETGSVVANFIWKIQCLSGTPPVLDVPKTGETPEETT